MAKIHYILLFLLLSYRAGFTEQGKVKIVFCDDYYCTQMPTDEEYKIVKQVDWAANKVTLSPDEKYVVYTTSNWLGFENEGRDVFYCKVDGSEITFLHKFEFSVDTLMWASSDDRDFIFVISWDCFPGHGGIQVIDLNSKTLIITFRGNSLQKIQNTDCYQVYCLDKPVQQGKGEICLKDLEAIRESDSLNMRFFIGWGNWDIYISTQRDQVLRFNEFSKSTVEQERALRNIMFSEQFVHSKIIPYQKNNRIIFFGNDTTSGFCGVVDTENKKLLLFDNTDSSKFSNASWSPDGTRFAVIRLSNWQKYIDFYEIDEKGKVGLIRTKSMTGDGQLSDFRWSDDSKTFYFLYLLSNSQKVQYIVDVEDK